MVLVPFSVVIQTANGDRAVTLTWDSIIGRKYQVQCRDAFDSAGWRDLGAPLTATDLTASQTDPAAGLSAQRIYRVITAQ